MAVPAEGNAKQELEQSADEELDENEAQNSLDDFLRDINELVDSTTEDNVRSPASSDVTEARVGLSDGVTGWVMQQFRAGVDPRRLLETVLLPGATLPADFDEITLWSIVLRCMAEPEPRNKLTHVNTLDDVVSLLKTSSKIIILTGAGISVSCGIPDFRSANGVYARLAVEYPDLPDPQAMFDISYFKDDPRPFFNFAKEIYPGQFHPSPSHYFISELEKRNKLLRNYTQNIDTLEQTAGITRVIQCHGSFATASCMHCKYQVNAEEIKEDIFNQVVPQCPKCCSGQVAQSDESNGDDCQVLTIMKPDIVFFGEGLPDVFHHTLEQDKLSADLLVVIGSSLKVRPVALVPSILDDGVPQVLINREPLKHLTFDVELLGDCDVIIAELCRRLGSDWLQGIGLSPTHKSADFTHVPPSRYLFQGADLEKCATTDTLDTSGSSDNAPVNQDPEYKGPSTCINEGQQSDIEGCDGTALEGLSSQEKSIDIKSPTGHQASSTTETKNTSSDHNEAVSHDVCEPLNKKPKLD